VLVGVGFVDGVRTCVSLAGRPDMGVTARGEARWGMRALLERHGVRSDAVDLPLVPRPKDRRSPFKVRLRNRGVKLPIRASSQAQP
jgi:hypothetical protein